MLDKQDITLLQDMMDTTLSKTLKVALETNNRVFKRELKMEWRTDFRDMLTQNNLDLKRDLRDEMHSLISASEYRTTTRIDSLSTRIDSLSTKVDDLKSGIVFEVCEVISDAILPQINVLQIDMGLVKNHLKLA